MTTPHWRQLGFLTPDALECQQDIWALQARLRGSLADTLAELAARTAEPTWGASLSEAGERSRALAEALRLEAGDAAQVRLDDDEPARAFELALGEVLASGHVASLISTGFAVLGELGTAPIRLLDEVAGPHARQLSGRVLGADDHALLGRLLAVTQPGQRDADNLRRMLRYLYAKLYDVYQAWRQSFHTLGVDGEHLQEEVGRTVRAAHQTLGLPITRADTAFLRVG